MKKERNERKLIENSLLDSIDIVFKNYIIINFENIMESFSQISCRTRAYGNKHVLEKSHESINTKEKLI